MNGQVTLLKLNFEKKDNRKFFQCNNQPFLSLQILTQSRIYKSYKDSIQMNKQKQIQLQFFSNIKFVYLLILDMAQKVKLENNRRKRGKSLFDTISQQTQKAMNQYLLEFTQPEKPSQNEKSRHSPYKLWEDLYLISAYQIYKKLPFAEKSCYHLQICKKLSRINPLKERIKKLVRVTDRELLWHIQNNVDIKFEYKNQQQGKLILKSLPQGQYTRQELQSLSSKMLSSSCQTANQNTSKQIYKYIWSASQDQILRSAIVRGDLEKLEGIVQKKGLRITLFRIKQLKILIMPKILTAVLLFFT